jgi:hypothetical protein
MSEAPTPVNNKFNRTLVLSGWVLLLVLVVGLTGASIWLHAAGIPSAFIDDMAKSALIFMFGTFPMMVRSFMTGGEQ